MMSEQCQLLRENKCLILHSPHLAALYYHIPVSTLPRGIGLTLKIKKIKWVEMTWNLHSSEL